MLAYIFLLLAVAVRVLSGTGYFSPMGFTPLGASLLFFGAHMPRKRLWIPVSLLVACDLYITLGKYHMSLTWDQGFIWAWYLGACFVGVLLKGRIKPQYVAGAALVSAMSFYAISNFGVWASGYVGYPKNLTGLIAAYVAAIPFFERGLASDLTFSAAFFSLPVLIARTRQAIAEKASKNAAA